MLKSEEEAAAAHVYAEVGEKHTDCTASPLRTVLCEADVEVAKVSFFMHYLGICMSVRNSLLLSLTARVIFFFISFSGIRSF